MFNVFTISRLDVYDFLRCPKIVSIKTYRNLKKPRPQKKRNVLERNLRHEIGTIGEVVTQRMFSGRTEDEKLSEYDEELFSEEADDEEFELDYNVTQPSSLAGELVQEKEMPLLPLNFDLKRRGVQLDTEMKELSKKTGFGRDVIERITSDSLSHSMWLEIKKLEKEMGNELNPWKKLVGKKHFEILKNAAKGQTTKLYPLPEKSQDFVKKSWEEWV